MRQWLLITLAALTLCSCSVKEDRSVCPVFVTLRVDEFVHKGLSEGAVIFGKGEDSYRKKLSFLPIMDDGLTYPCSRSSSAVAVVSGLDKSQYRGDVLCVPIGCEADPLWTYGELFVADADDYIVKAVPYKQYCKIRFTIRGLSDMLDYPWRYRIKAGCNGLNLLSSQAVEGAFETVVYPDTTNEWYVLLPRQKDSDITLELFLPDGLSDRHGELQYSFSLKSAFEGSGYDWSAKSLEDIAIAVDYTRGEVSVSIDDWEKDDSYSNEQI